MARLGLQVQRELQVLEQLLQLELLLEQRLLLVQLGRLVLELNIRRLRHRVDR